MRDRSKRLPPEPGTDAFSAPKILHLEHNLADRRYWTLHLSDGSHHRVSTPQLRDPAQLNEVVGFEIAPTSHTVWFRQLDALMEPLRALDDIFRPWVKPV